VMSGIKVLDNWRESGESNLDLPARSFGLPRLKIIERERTFVQGILLLQHLKDKYPFQEPHS